MTGHHQGYESRRTRRERLQNAQNKNAMVWYPMYSPEEAIRKAGGLKV